jgi:hypothetical protein
MTPRVARRPSRPAPHALTFASSTDPMRLERRRGVRTRATGELVATFRDGEGRIGLTSVNLIDSSDGGLGILSPVQIEPGMVVTLRDARTRQPWSDATAVRCQREDGRYHIGLELTRRMAA